MRIRGLFPTGLLILAALTLAGCSTEFGGEGGFEPYTLTIQAEGKGLVTPGVGTHQYPDSSVVDLVAQPEEGWSFSHWEGPVADPAASQTTIVIDKQRSVKAVFENNTISVTQPPGGLISWRNDGSRVLSRPGLEQDIQYIMIHAISDSVANPTDPFRMNRIRSIFDSYRVEAHYAIDRDGRVYQFVEDHLIARHAGVGRWANDPKLTNNMNRYSIGIELLGIGSSQEMLGVIGANSNNRVNEKDRGYTDQQYQALQTLVRRLMSRYQIPGTNVIGHDEYDPNRKWDPGVLFDWTRIKTR